MGRGSISDVSCLHSMVLSVLAYDTDVLQHTVMGAMLLRTAKKSRM